jgi:hypothetical protein
MESFTAALIGIAPQPEMGPRLALLSLDFKII